MQPNAGPEMTILLCLLSDQHVPNLLSVHHFKPDQLVLVESDGMQSKGVATHFLGALKKGGLDYDSRHHVQRVASEDDLAHVTATLQDSWDRHPSGDWIANLTGGTKPMSIATHEFFKTRGCRLVYTNSRQPERIIDLTTGLGKTCDHRLSVDEFVTGYGFHLAKPADELLEARQRAEQPLWKHTANILASHASGRDVLALDEAEREKARKKGITLPAERFAFPSPDVRSMWVDGAATRSLTKYEGEFLTGGWLEVFCYNLLSRHADALALWDVSLGQSIGHKDLSNEIDVCFMHKQGLAMVECKSGSQEHDLSRGMDTLFKVEAVAKQLRALRVRSYLATTGENVLDKTGKVRAALQSRADFYNCRILPRDQIAELARLELADSPDTAKKIAELFGLAFAANGLKA